MYEFKHGTDLIRIHEELKIPISEVGLQYEIEKSEKSKEEIWKVMQFSLEVMKSGVKQSITEDIKTRSGLIGGEAKKLNARIQQKKNLCGDLITKGIAYGMGTMEVNGSMGRVVASPTAGACGILPGVLISLQEERGIDEETLIRGLFTAGAIGMVIAHNATLSGAAGGCQAETGSAASMAAGAIVEMLGGTPEQVLDAAAMALKNVLGLVCDPIAGLVEAPCQKRNALGVANAFISAEIALAGIKSIIPFDEVVDAMYKVGNSMPCSLRETAQGGLAATKTGKRLYQQIYHEGGNESQ